MTHTAPVMELRPPEEEVPASAHERQARFESTLRTIRIISQMAGNVLPVYSMRDPDNIINSPGVYVLSQHMGSGRQILDTNFDSKKLLLSGAADSAHSVIAGSLTVDYRGGEKREANVAAKCYSKRTSEERFERAMREVSIMEDLQSRGELTLEPMAIAIAPENQTTDGEVVLLTRYNPNILSLDNLPWGRGVSDEKNVQTAVTAAQTLGRFNAHYGYRHGDAKIKNVAVEYGRGACMIDFETSSSFDPTDPFSSAETALEDFGLFVDSLEKRDFLNRDGLQQTRDAINTIGEEYLATWGEAPDGVQMAVAHQVAMVTHQFDPATTIDLRD